MGNQINNEPTFVDQSSSESSSVVTHDEQQLSPRSRCLPWCMRRGNYKEPFMVQGIAPTDDELGLAKAILREANANCEDGAWSLLDLFRQQRQEDQNNEASSFSPDPPSKPWRVVVVSYKWYWTILEQTNCFQVWFFLNSILFQVWRSFVFFVNLIPYGFYMKMSSDKSLS